MNNDGNGKIDESAGFRPVRENTVTLPERPSKSENVLAVCLVTDDPKLLIPMKIYRIGPRGEYARVIDEEGEVAIYPLSSFLVLPLPKETAQKLEMAIA
jgi:hypothetical protein